VVISLYFFFKYLIIITFIVSQHISNNCCLNTSIWKSKVCSNFNRSASPVYCLCNQIRFDNNDQKWNDKNCLKHFIPLFAMFEQEELKLQVICTRNEYSEANHSETRQFHFKCTQLLQHSPIKTCRMVKLSFTYMHLLVELVVTESLPNLKGGKLQSPRKVRFLILWSTQAYKKIRKNKFRSILNKKMQIILCTKDSVWGGITVYL